MATNIFCVNTHSQEFKDTAKRLDLNEGQLEGILHEYFNRDDVTDKDTYPSDIYIQSQYQGKSFIATEDQAQLRESRYSEPIQAVDKETLDALVKEAELYFPKEAIGVKQKGDNSFEVNVGEPLFNKDLSSPVYTIFNELLRNKGDIFYVARGTNRVFVRYSGTVEGINVINPRYRANFNTKQVNKDIETYVQNIAAQYGVPAQAVKFLPVEKGIRSAVEVTIDTEAFKDSIPSQSEIQTMYGSDEVYSQHLTLLNFLADKTGLKYEFISDDRANELLKKEGRDANRVNAFVQGDTVYYIKGKKFNVDIASEEMLHPFVASINLKNKEAFSSLLEDAKKAFPKLTAQIQSTYTTNQNEELVTQALARAFRQDYEENPNHTSIQDLLQKFIDFIKEWFRDAGDWVLTKGDKIYAQDLGENITLENLAKIINSEFELGDANKIDRTVLNQENISEASTTTEITPASEREIFEQIRPDLQEFMAEQTIYIKQINNMLESDVITSSDISEAASIVAFWVSDTLNLYQENPETLFNNFDNFKKTNNWETEEDKQKDIESIKKLSRKEIVEKIGVNNFKKRFKTEVLESTALIYGENAIEAMEQADFFKDNFEGLMVFANALIGNNEGFILKEGAVKNTEANFEELTVDGAVDSIVEELGNENDESFDKESIEEVVRDMTEHYAIESRTLDVWKTATQAVKDVIKKCYVLEPQRDKDNNIITDEKGDTVYKPRKNKFALDQHLDEVIATQSILHWVQGSLNSQDMIDKLKAKADANPWVKQIIAKLEDTSGKESDFRSQFFKSFYKPWQSYSVQLKNKKTNINYTVTVNETPALKAVMDMAQAQFSVGNHPLFTSVGIETKAFNRLKAIRDNLVKGRKNKLFNTINNDENKRIKLAQIIANASAILAYPVSVDDVLKVLTEENFNTMTDSLAKIVSTLENNINNKEYNAFAYGKNSIIGYTRTFFSPLVSILEDIEKGSFNANGKMYQGYVTPSYIKKLFDKFHSNDAAFEEFLANEYASTEWFVNKIDDHGNLRMPTIQELRTNKMSAWRSYALELLAGLTEDERKEWFDHKVLLNYQGKEYMRNMTSSEYAMSVLTEFASETGKEGQTMIPAWYIFPMESNKPSQEFFKFFRFIGNNYKEVILDGMFRMFNQELSRIQTVKMRGLEKGQPGYIENWDGKDGNGSKFVFVPWMNDYLEGGSLADSEAGKAIQKKLNGIEVSSEELQAIEDAFKDKTIDFFDNKETGRVAQTIAKFKERGIYESLSSVENVPSSKEGKDAFIENFVWNHIFAENSFLQLTVTDIAFYKNSEDLQKRLAQLHSPGLIGDRYARDYNGRQVSDGKFRTIYLEDLKGIAANVVDNLKAYFEQRKAKMSGRQAELYQDFVDKFLSNYEGFTVTDGQAFTTMTGWRKKSYVYGNWAKDMEAIWDKFRRGELNITDLDTAFQVKKPFTYSQIHKNMHTPNAPIQNMKMGVQHKDSEALLWMANAIIGDTDTGKPNILRAIMRVMEQSHFTQFSRKEGAANGSWSTIEGAEEGNTSKVGIDTAVFHSGVKDGYMTGVNLNDLLDNPNGEELAVARLYDLLYDPTSLDGYNDLYVHEIPIEDVSQQLEISEHFRDHENIWGSQERVIIESAVDAVFGGNPVEYTINDANGERKLNAKEFQSEYEKTVAQNIRDSIDTLLDELSLNGDYSFKNQLDRKVALSKILQNEIINNPARYGSDLLIACSVDPATGEFRIPFGDPIQSKRIEQLLNSIVKNRVNKQKFKGGPLVLVTNWGRSRRLHIIFKDKNNPGQVLMTKDQWENASDKKGYSSYDEYLKENQGAVAWFECAAPASSMSILKNFMDKDGFIDVEAISMIDGGEELLKMIGYRIPTEDMYSIAPFRIVEFLPKEMGDVFMQPQEMPAITGEDHDVDKKNTLIKELYIAKRFTWKDDSISDIEAAKVYTKNHKDAVIKKIIDSVPELDQILTSKVGVEAMKKLIERYKAEKDLKTGRIDYNYNNDYISERYADFLEQQAQKDYNKAVKKLPYKLKYVFVNDYLSGDVFQRANNDIQRAIKKAYMNIMFKVIEPTVRVSDTGEVVALGDSKEEKRIARNNHLFNMTWSVLTNEASVEKILNTGTFEPQKNLGYKVTIAKQHPEMSWEDIDALSTDDAKKLAFQSKYLPDFTDQMDYYENNSVAGNILGQAAVQRSAHALLKGNGYGVKIPQGEEFTLAGQLFSNFVEIDREFAYDAEVAGVLADASDMAKPLEITTGESIGKTLGNHVGAAADAAKDPVLNLLNINTSTFRTYAVMLRLGIPFKIAGIFLSSNPMTEAIEEQRRRGLTRATRLSDIVSEKLELLSKDEGLDGSVLKNEELTAEELIQSLRKPVASNMEDSINNKKISYKIYTQWLRFENMATAVQPLTVATRYNSVASAVGPQIADNIIWKHKTDFSVESSEVGYQLGKLVEDNNNNKIFRNISIDDVLSDHPMLAEFARSYDIADILLEGFPAMSKDFEMLWRGLNVWRGLRTNLKDTILRDKGLLSGLIDFYTSFLLVENGVINPKNLYYFINTFPKEFIRGNYKEKYKGNAFIDAVKPDIRSNRTGDESLILKIDTANMGEQDKSKIRLGWYQFHKQEPEMSRRLFEYNFALAGIGFSPKSFMSLLPTQIRELIPGYIETFRKLPSLGLANHELIVDQWIRNNWNERKLVPKISIYTNSKPAEGVTINVSEENNEPVTISVDTRISPVFKDQLYFRTKVGDKNVMFKLENYNKGINTYSTVAPLGDNGSYLEISNEEIITPLRPTSDLTANDFASNSSNDTEGGLADNTEPNRIPPKTDAQKANDIQWLREHLVDNEGNAIKGEGFYNSVERGIKADEVEGYVNSVINILNRKGIQATPDFINELRKRLCA